MKVILICIQDCHISLLEILTKAATPKTELLISIVNRTKRILTTLKSNQNLQLILKMTSKTLYLPIIFLEIITKQNY